MRKKLLWALAVAFALTAIYVGCGSSDSAAPGTVVLSVSGDAQ